MATLGLKVGDRVVIDASASKPKVHTHTVNIKPAPTHSLNVQSEIKLLLKAAVVLFRSRGSNSVVQCIVRSRTQIHAYSACVCVYTMSYMCIWHVCEYIVSVK